MDGPMGLRYPYNEERDILAAAFEIENEQDFHMKELYKHIQRTLYYDEHYKSYWDDDKPEILYFENRLTNGLIEHRIWWRWYRIPGGLKYMRYFIKIDFQTLAMTKKEVIKGGRKFKLDHGTVTIRIQAFLQLDYKDEWGKNWFLKNWDRYFRHRIYLSQIKYHKRELYKKAYKVQEKIKQFLQLETASDREKNFMPQLGLRDQ